MDKKKGTKKVPLKQGLGKARKLLGRFYPILPSFSYSFLSPAVSYFK